MDQLLVSGGGGITEKNKVPKITAPCKSNVLSPTDVKKNDTHGGLYNLCSHNQWSGKHKSETASMYIYVRSRDFHRSPSI